MAQCDSCGAEILWVKTIKGKSMPLDAQPVVDGNIVLLKAAAVILSKEQLGQPGRDGPRYKSHFATCPNASQHRKER